MPGIEISRFATERHYSDEAFSELTASLKSDRQDWLDSFDGLNPEIRDVFKI